MKTHLPLIALFAVVISTSGCDAFGEDGVEGVWVESGLDEDAQYIDYIRVTESTLTINDVYQPLDCADGEGGEYGLTSSDGTVLTFGEGSREYRISQDGDELIVTRSGEPTRYERSGFDPERADDCFDLLEPITQNSWSSSNDAEVLSTRYVTAEYHTSYDRSNDCYRSTVDLYVVEADGRSFTFQDVDSDDEIEFEVSESGARVTGPDGVTLSEGGFARRCF